MRLVLQRVTDAKVSVDNAVIGEIGLGFLVLVGFGAEDSLDMVGSASWKKLIDKLVNLRVFEDEDGRFNRSLADKSGDLLLVSQFTLFADCKKGRRPSFSKSCPPAEAEPLFDRFVADVQRVAPGQLATGQFGAEMYLDFTNWGPVTILLDSDEL